MANSSLFYLQADEIDHITIRYTDFGEKLDRKASIKKILSYVSRYDDVAQALDSVKTDKASLENMTDSEIYEILVRVRTVLLEKGEKVNV